MKEIKGANMEIDFSCDSWEHGQCPWNPKKKCAIKGVSICKYFKGIKPLDVVLCSYPKKGGNQ